MKVTILGRNGLKTVNINRRIGIRAKCLNCAGYSYKEVTNCEFVNCHLHLFRSGTGRQNAEVRSKAIRKYCLWCMNDKRGDVSRCPSIDCSLFPYRKTKIGRAPNIKSLSKISHIEGISVDKITNESNSSSEPKKLTGV